MISQVTAVKLREWLESDLPFLLAVRNNVALQAQLLATARGSDEAAVRAWLTRRTEGPGRIFRVIAETKTDRPVGFLQADVVNESLDGWNFGICIDPPFQGVGYGTMALVALEKELADRFGARNIKLEVDSTNYRAIRCYKRLGYEEQGAPAREVMVCDKPRKAISMAKSLERIGDHQ